MRSHSAGERAFALRQCSDAGGIFIALTQTEGNEKFLAFASKEGFQRHVIGVFKDRTGRPSLELFRFEKTLALEQHVER